MFAKTLLVIAIVSLFHAAYSAYEHSSHLKALGKPKGSLPLNIVYETVIALVLGMIGASLNAPPLRDISWASEMKKRTIDEMDSRLGFANYHSRAKSIFVPLP